MSIFIKGGLRNHCPDIEELVKFVLGINQSAFIQTHLTQCEICEDLAGGINAFKKEKPGITPEQLHHELINKDEASLKTLKLPENQKDIISEMSQELGLPDIIEKRIRKVLEFPLDEPIIKNKEDRHTDDQDNGKGEELK